MSADGSITLLLNILKQGPSDISTQRLYERYIANLERVARGKLAGRRLRDGDEQDLASLVMEQFFAGVRKGCFPKLNDRHDLWQIFMMLVARRAVDIYRKTPEPLCGESVLLPPGGDTSQTSGGMASIPDQEPTPDTVVEMEEELRQRLSQLPEDLQKVAVWRMEGLTNAEIAGRLGRSVKRVEAKLNLIRKIWSSSRP